MGIRGTSCCGVKEFEALGDAIKRNHGVEGTMRLIAKDVLPQGSYSYYAPFPCAFMLFTGTTRGRYGPRLKSFIENHELGKVWETEARKNPNSGNDIKCWLWAVNHQKLKEWHDSSKDKVKTAKKKSEVGGRVELS